VSKGTSKYMGALARNEGRITPVSFGGKGGANAGIISESGLYKLIMRSDKDTARPFQDWVTQHTGTGCGLTLRKAGLADKP